MREENVDPILLKRLSKIVARLLKISEADVVPALRQDQVESWDSLQNLILITELEQEFNITMQTEDIIKISSIADIVAVLVERGANHEG